MKRKQTTEVEVEATDCCGREGKGKRQRVPGSGSRVEHSCQATVHDSRTVARQRFSTREPLPGRRCLFPFPSLSANQSPSNSFLRVELVSSPFLTPPISLCVHGTVGTICKLFQFINFLNFYFFVAK